MKIFIIALLLLYLSITKCENRISCKITSAYPQYFVQRFSSECYYNPNVLSDVMSIASKLKYSVSKHSVSTDDGYNLTIFQIDPKKPDDTKPPIFIQHGLNTNADSWVITGHNRSLAFALADLGYQVFLGNLRGTTYSRKSYKYDNSKWQYWNYSVDSLAKYDFPTQIKFVSKLTGSKILYLGHSLGTTIYFMYASEEVKEAQNLIQASIALAPIVYIRENIFFRLVKPLLDLSIAIKWPLALYYHEDLIRALTNTFCPLIPDICRWSQYILLGVSKQFLPDDLLAYFSVYPTSASMTELLQLVQIHNTREFKKIDYGSAKNKKAYGSSTPPLYDLGKIKIPTYLFYGNNDGFTDKKLVEKVYNDLGSKVKYIQSVPKDNATYAFNHFDFVIGAFVKEFLYKDMFAKISNYTKKAVK